MMLTNSVTHKKKMALKIQVLTIVTIRTKKKDLKQEPYQTRKSQWNPKAQNSLYLPATKKNEQDKSESN